MAATPRGIRGAGALVLALAALLAGCGGGGGGGTADPGPVAGNPGGAPPPDGGGGTAPSGPPRIEPYERTTVAAARAKSLAAPLASSAVPAAAEVRLGPLPALMVKAKLADLARPAPASVPRQIGVGRDLPATTESPALGRLLAWQPTASGGQVASVRFRADGAAGVRLGLRVSALPEGAQVRVRGEHASQAVSDADLRRAGFGVYWLPAMAGEAATLEIELPAGADPSQVRLAVPRLVHLWWTHAGVSDAAGLKVGEAGACNVDATCDPDYAFEARSIARMEYVDGESAFLCTGTLMADTQRSGTPYFLSANHCVSNQTVADSVSTYWFYRAAACNSNQLDPAATQRHGGAQLLYASAETDTSFVRLNQPPPVGAVHAGSLLAPLPGDTLLAGLHHPGGDLLKLSLGLLRSYASCQGTACTLEPGDTGNYLVLRWRSGTTESGSSGSPVFAAVGERRYVVGQLFAGSASCAFPDAPDYYGRFDKAYPRLRQWLGDVPGAS